MGGAPLPDDPNAQPTTPGMADGVDNRGAGDQPTQQVYAASKEFYQ
jgi:hypothetical protein